MTRRRTPYPRLASEAPSHVAPHAKPRCVMFSVRRAARGAAWIFSRPTRTPTLGMNAVVLGWAQRNEVLQAVVRRVLVVVMNMNFWIRHALYEAMLKRPHLVCRFFSNVATINERRANRDGLRVSVRSNSFGGVLAGNLSAVAWNIVFASRAWVPLAFVLTCLGVESRRHQFAASASADMGNSFFSGHIAFSQVWRGRW